MNKVKAIKVYVVNYGERGEGGTVTGVYKTKAKAIKAALSTQSIFGQWLPDRLNELMWTNGCDYVQVETFELK